MVHKKKDTIHLVLSKIKLKSNAIHIKGGGGNLKQNERLKVNN